MNTLNAVGFPEFLLFPIVNWSPFFLPLQDTVSVHRPGFYAERFQRFMCSTVFKKIPRKYPVERTCFVSF